MAAVEPPETGRISQLLRRPTPVSAPALVAADPDAAACDVPALLLDRLPGGPPDPWLRRMEDWVAAALAALGG